jgi:hypothetical protein
MYAHVLLMGILNQLYGYICWDISLAAKQTYDLHVSKLLTLEINKFDNSFLFIGVFV